MNLIDQLGLINNSLNYSGYKMLSRLFKKKTTKTVVTLCQADTNQGWLPVIDSVELLSEPKRQNYLKEIWDLTSFTEKSFIEVIKNPISNLANLVQQVPGSESHHHSYLGGLLDHSLECMIFALKIRRKHMLPPGATPEEQSFKGDIWSAGIALAALSHDISKPLLDLEFELKDGQSWSLLDGPIPKSAGYYRFRFNKERIYKTHGVSSSLLFSYLVSGDVFKWLQTDVQLVNLLLMTLSGHSENGGIVSEIVLQADMASVGQNMGGNPNAIPFEAPKDTLQSKLRAGLKEIVREKFKLNDQGAHGFYDHASESLYLVSMRAANELRAHLLSLGIESVPSNNPPLFDELQSHNLIIPNTSGKAIWKCVVTIGKWETELTMLKVNPALIWDVVPELKSIQVKVVAETKEPTETKSNPAPTSSVANINSEVEDSSVADLLSLFTETETEINNTCAAPVIDLTPVNDQATAKKSSPKVVTEKSNSGTCDVDAVKFYDWLRDGIVHRKIIINDTNAAIHTVRGRYFLVSPKVFKRYASEIYGTDEKFVEVQNVFQKLGIHERTALAQNIFSVAVNGTRKTSMIRGYLLKECDLPPPLPDNPFLKMISEVA
jgi:integrating conjugative element relaxase (TIGR03760 family)